MTRRLTHIPNSQARLDELLYRLEVLKPAEAREVLFEGLQDSYPPIRHAAALALAERMTDEVATLLQSLVRGEEITDPARAAGLPRDLVPAPESPVRSAAAMALRGSTSPASEETLLDATRSEDADLRYHALVSLHHMDARPERLRPVVEERITDTDSEVVVVASQLAAQHRWVELLSALVEARTRFTGDARLQISFSLAELLCELPAPARAERVDSALISELVEEFIGALEHEPTIAAATHALAALGAEAAVEPLQKLLERWRTHPILKVGVAAALIELDQQSGHDYLLEALQSKRKDARGYAMRVVGYLGLAKHEPYLLEVAASDDYHADTALLALEDLGSKSAHEAIEMAARSHPDSHVRKLAGERWSALSRDGTL